MAKVLSVILLFFLVFTFVLTIDDPAFAQVSKKGSPCEGSSQSVSVTSQAGHINTPGFPHYFYPSDSLCRWNLTSPHNTRISLASEVFSVESTPSCLFDHLLIFDGPSDKSPVLGRYCGDEALNVVTSSNHAFLVFFSDVSHEDRGFNIIYESTTLPFDGVQVVENACNRTIFADSEPILSPEYPLPYSSNARCYYKLKAPADYAIEIIFKHFTLEEDSHCNNDFLTIYDGYDQDAMQLGRYCGKNYPETVRSDSNEMFIYFQSDNYFELGGFNLTVRFLSVELQLFGEEMSENSLIVAGDPDCSGIKEDSEGAVTTPSYPIEYPHLKKCIVIIRAPRNNVIRLNFSDFLLEDSQDCEFDWLRMLDGERHDSPVIGRYCGNSLSNTTVTSLGSTLRLEFESDVSVEHTGFRADYQIVKRDRDCPLDCVNGGKCKEDEDGHHCECPTGWGGKLCQTRVTSCLDGPCLHGGKCSRTPVAYRCDCSDKYEGKHCESRTSLRFTSVPTNATLKGQTKQFLECGVNKEADIIWLTM